MLRKPESQSSKEVIIEDPALEPYFISMPREGGFIVYQRIQRGKNGTKYNRAVSYPSTLSRSVKAIQRELMLSGEVRNFKSLQEFVKSWEELGEKLKIVLLGEEL